MVDKTRIVGTTPVRVSTEQKSAMPITTAPGRGEQASQKPATTGSGNGGNPPKVRR